MYVSRTPCIIDPYIKLLRDYITMGRKFYVRIRFKNGRIDIVHYGKRRSKIDRMRFLRRKERDE